MHIADIQTFVEESVDMYAIAGPPWFVQVGPRADTKKVAAKGDGCQGQ